MNVVLRNAIVLGFCNVIVKNLLDVAQACTAADVLGIQNSKMENTIQLTICWQQSAVVSVHPKGFWASKPWLYSVASSDLLRTRSLHLQLFHLTLGCGDYRVGKLDLYQEKSVTT